MVGRADGRGDRADHDGYFVVVAGGSLPVLLAFQKVDDPTPGKNRIHLDLTAEDLEGEVDRLVVHGRRSSAAAATRASRWVTMSDPQGNQFCVAGQAEAAASYRGRERCVRAVTATITPRRSLCAVTDGLPPRDRTTGSPRTVVECARS